MSHDRKPARPELADDDLAAEDVAALPDRQAMSRISLDLDGIDNFAMPINEATAVNIASSESIAVADADQVVIITQLDED